MAVPRSSAASAARISLTSKGSTDSKCRPARCAPSAAASPAATEASDALRSTIALLRQYVRSAVTAVRVVLIRRDEIGQAGGQLGIIDDEKQAPARILAARAVLAGNRALLIQVAENRVAALARGGHSDLYLGGGRIERKLLGIPLSRRCDFDVTRLPKIAIPALDLGRPLR